MSATYHLALLPDRGDGQPDFGVNPVVLGPLPEGTRKLDIDAHWHVDNPDRTFKGGTTTLTIDLEGD